MLMRFDLHTHTISSDGVYSPEDVVELAINEKVSGIAITDHDTVGGVRRANEHAKTKDLMVIPGIEFSCSYDSEEVHILGYFIDINNQQLLNKIKILKEERLNRGIKIVNKLQEMKIDISLEDVKMFSKEDIIGRPHIARALISKGYVRSIEKAFDIYLNYGKPAYVDRYKLSIEEAIYLIKISGGVPVLAHPGLLKNKNIIDFCIGCGIEGIESIYSKHNEKDTRMFMNIAKENNLIITGGTDFHGDNLNLKIGMFSVDNDVILKLLERSKLDEFI